MYKLIGIILCTILISCASVAKKPKISNAYLILSCYNMFIKDNAPPTFAFTMCKCLVESDYVRTKDLVMKDLILQECSIAASEALREEQDMEIQKQRNTVGR